MATISDADRSAYAAAVERLAQRLDALGFRRVTSVPGGAEYAITLGDIRVGRNLTLLVSRYWNRIDERYIHAATVHARVDAVFVADRAREMGNTLCQVAQAIETFNALEASR